MFVGEFADDFFDDVFEGNEARDPAIFIDDHRQVEVFGLHLTQQVIDRLHFDGELGGTHHLIGAKFMVSIMVFKTLNDVLKEQNSADIVGVLSNNGQARETGAHKEA